MERWCGKIAVVTGASSGIGAATAKLLVEKGLKVVGLARRSELIEELASTLTHATGDLIALKCDLTQESEIIEAFDWIKSNLGPIHILINNAGYNKPHNLTESDIEDWRYIFDLNVMALCICTKEAVKIMQENDIDGQIIHIGSVLGKYPINMPNLGVYPASKYAVTALTENLRQELNCHNSKIKISSISPGAVSTELFGRFRGSDPSVGTIPLLQPEDIAEAILYTLSTPPNVQVHDIIIHPLGEMI